MTSISSSLSRAGAARVPSLRRQAAAARGGAGCGGGSVPSSVKMGPQMGPQSAHLGVARGRRCAVRVRAAEESDVKSASQSSSTRDALNSILGGSIDEDAAREKEEDERIEMARTAEQNISFTQSCPPRPPPLPGHLFLTADGVTAHTRRVILLPATSCIAL
jgi:hypothetical protein